jgi:hypothetical protein
LSHQNLINISRENIYGCKDADEQQVPVKAMEIDRLIRRPIGRVHI